MTSRRMRITREGSSSQRDFDDYVWNTLKIIIPNYKDIFKYFFRIKHHNNQSSRERMFLYIFRYAIFPLSFFFSSNSIEIVRISDCVSGVENQFRMRRIRFVWSIRQIKNNISRKKINLTEWTIRQTCILTYKSMNTLDTSLD